MIAPCDPYLEAFAKAGSDIITVHVEAGPHVHRSLQAIRALGKKAGVTMNPATPVSSIEHVIDLVDLILVMSVNPGFGGQASSRQLSTRFAMSRALVGARPIDIESRRRRHAGQCRARRPGRRQCAGRRLRRVQGRQLQGKHRGDPQCRGAGARGSSVTIPRYSRPEMAAIWSPETKFRIWFEIEAHAADAMANLGIIPKEAAKTIWEKGKAAKFDVARIDAIEAEVKHDVIAFLTHLAEIVGPEARFVHSGMTSSDVLDTCFNVQLVRAADILIADIDGLLAALKRRAFEHKTDADRRPLARHPCRADHLRPQARVCLCRVRARARTAGRGAQGSRDLRHFRRGRHLRAGRSARRSPCRQGDGPCASSRSRRRSSRATATRCILRRSASSPPRSSGSPPKSAICSAPKCWKPRSSSPRSRRAPRRCRTSAIPVLSENVTGLARMVRGLRPAGDGKRRALARARHLAFVGRAHDRPRRHRDARFRAGAACGLIDKLVVYPANMQKNLDKLGGLIHSQRVLIALTQKGVAARGRLPPRAAQRHEGLGRRRAISSSCSRPTRTCGQSFQRQGARGQFRPRPSLQARRYDLQAGVRRMIPKSMSSTTIGDGNRFSDEIMRALEAA